MYKKYELCLKSTIVKLLDNLRRRFKIKKFNTYIFLIYILENKTKLNLLNPPYHHLKNAI